MSIICNVVVLSRYIWILDIISVIFVLILDIMLSLISTQTVIPRSRTTSKKTTLGTMMNSMTAASITGMTNERRGWGGGGGGKETGGDLF